MSIHVCVCGLYNKPIKTKLTKQTKPNTETKDMSARLTKLVKEESDVVLLEGLHLHQVV